MSRKRERERSGFIDIEFAINKTTSESLLIEFRFSMMKQKKKKKSGQFSDGNEVKVIDRQTIQANTIVYSWMDGGSIKSRGGGGQRR